MSLKVFDYTGKELTELKAKNEPGLNMVAWNLAGRGGPGGPGGMRGRRGGRSETAEQAKAEKPAAGNAAEATGAKEAPSGSEKSKTGEAKSTGKTAKAATAAAKPAATKQSGEKQPGGALATPATSGATAAISRGAAPAEEEIEGPPPEIASFFGVRGPPQVAAGMYRVVLTVDGKDQSQWFKVEADPNHPETGAAARGEDLAPEDYDP